MPCDREMGAGEGPPQRIGRPVGTVRSHHQPEMVTGAVEQQALPRAAFVMRNPWRSQWPAAAPQFQRQRFDRIGHRAPRAARI
jgi:hypothetical protein